MRASSCDALALPKTTQKKCEQCGRALVKPANLRISVFKSRRFCSRHCSQMSRSAIARRGLDRNCVICERPFQKADTNRQRKGKCCSTACYRLLQKSRRAQRESSYKCPICSGPMRNRRTTHGEACSLECGQKRRSRGARTRRDADCLVCKAAFVSKLNVGGWTKYCSLKCWKSVQSIRPSLLTVQCAHCGASVKRTEALVRRVSKTFCSPRCQQAALRGSDHANWRGGADPNRGAGWAKLAESIRRRDGYCCQRCGRTQVDNSQRLSVDHIRPWRLFECAADANNPGNLISLCRKCHGWKTTVAERRMLIGDNIAFSQYKQSISLQSEVAR